MRMKRSDGTATVIEIDKMQYTADAGGIYTIPDSAIPDALAAGFVAADVPRAGPDDAPKDSAASNEPTGVEASEIAAAAEEIAAPIATPATVPMRAPAGLSGVSHDGVDFVIPNDRICEVPVDAVEMFVGMGFVPADQPENAEATIGMRAPTVWKIPASAVDTFAAMGFTRV